MELYTQRTEEKKVIVAEEDPTANALAK